MEPWNDLKPVRYSPNEENTRIREAMTEMFSSVPAGITLLDQDIRIAYVKWARERNLPVATDHFRWKALEGAGMTRSNVSRRVVWTKP